MVSLATPQAMVGLTNYLDEFSDYSGATNLFDEIEQLLQINKDKYEQHQYGIDTGDAKTTMFEPAAPPQILVHNNVTTELAMREERARVFSVESGRLQPIVSPYLLPGIYKKTPSDVFDAPEARESNVFLTTAGTPGRIVSASCFHKLFMCADRFDELPADVPQLQPRGAVLWTNGTSQESEALPVLYVQRNNRKVQEPWDALSKLAYNILQITKHDHVVIDRRQNEIVRTDNVTNQRTIYRFLPPETLGLQPRACEAKQPMRVQPAKEPIKLKLGRPRKLLRDDQVGPLLKTRSQPKPKETRKQKNRTASAAEEGIAAPQEQPSTLSTRSGRVVKLTLRRLVQSAAPTVPSPVASKSMKPEVVPDPPEDSAAMMRNFLAELKDSDFRCRKAVTLAPLQQPNFDAEEKVEPLPLAASSPTKRHIPPEAICPTCKKIFLGRRIKRHFVQYPDHMRVPQALPFAPMATSSEQSSFDDASADYLANQGTSLFNFLMKKLQKSGLNEDQRADLFLNELNDLVEQLHLRSSRLVRNTSGLHLVTVRTARVLGIPEGQYALDMAALEAPPEPETTTTSLMNFEHINASALPPPTVNTRSLDYTTLSMSLDGTLTDEAAQKLNLSAGGKLLPPSEESLLRAVDDLVPVPDMTKLTSTNLHLTPTEHIGDTHSGTTLVPHYDHASDNAVEAVSMKETGSTSQGAQPILDLAVDFFQFNNN